jgi:hypothetical protein
LYASVSDEPEEINRVDPLKLLVDFLKHFKVKVRVRCVWHSSGSTDLGDRGALRDYGSYLPLLGHIVQ